MNDLVETVLYDTEGKTIASVRVPKELPGVVAYQGRTFVLENTSPFKSWTPCYVYYERIPFKC